MSILTDILPAQYRKVLYVTYALVGLAFGAIQVVTEPAWLVDAFAVYAFIGGALGLTAGANVQPSGRHVAED